MKKRILRVTSLAAIAVSAILLARLGTVPAHRVTGAFESLPVGHAIPIRFQMDEDAFEKFTPLEKRHQMRDWLMYTVMSEAGMDAPTLRKALYDVPPLRAHYLEPVARFDYGDTRSRSLGNGEIVAVVPKADAATRADQLADLADREYKNSGERPRLVHVFEYDLDEDAATGRLTRMETVRGDALFQAAYGYVEKPIRSQDDLAALMGSIDELIAARMDAGTLYLAGRKRLATPYRGLRLEDTAAMWQSEREVQGAAARAKAFEDKWKAATYTTEDEKKQLQAEHDREFAALKASMPGSGQKDGFVKHSGFSLDPVYDYEALGQLFGRMEPYLRRTSADADAVASAGTAIAARNEGPFLKLLWDLEQSHNDADRVFSELAKNALKTTRFQHARYDGPLGGTEVGMVLFYTDLLAKLWALDFMETSPVSQVEDFVPLLKVDVSPIYEKELSDLSNTRLWFGPQDDGFQKTEHGILFAPKATRVYAASSNTLKPGEEGEPNAASGAFLGWWDNHYEQIARYEPEYQRLNEIMKWSLLLSWLGEQGEMDRLQFLQSVPVSRTAWFPEWARKNPNLRFRLWDRIDFYPKGYKGVATESLPLLQSRWVKLSRGNSALSGGVSLGSQDLLAERPVLPKDIDPLLRRSNLNYSAQEFGKEAFQTFDKTVYEFREGLDSSRFVVSASAKEGAKLRGPDSELRNAAFEYGYQRQVGGLAVDIRSGDLEVGRFTIDKTPDGGFAAAFKSRDIEHANKLGRVIDEAAGKGEDVARTLARQPEVESAVKMPNGYLVRTRGASSRWMLISSEGAPRANIADGVAMRYASMGGGGDARWNLAWVSDRQAGAELEKGDYIVIGHRAKGSPEGVAMEITNRGPPPSLGDPTEIELNYGDLRVKGQRYGEDGPIYIRRSAVPQELAGDARVLGKPSLPGGPGDSRVFFAKLQDGDYRPAAERLAGAPGDFRKSFAEYRNNAIDEIDDLARSGLHRDALRRLDDLIAAFGTDSELALRRDIIARAADLGDRLQKAPGLRAEAGVFEDGGTLKTEVRLLEMQRTAVPAGEARGDTVYVASDHVSLNSTDPNPGVHPSADQMITDDSVVHKLVNWEIAKAHPDVIVDVRTGTRYQLRQEIQTQHAGPNISVRLPQYVPLRQDPCSSEEERRRNASCNENVYLVDPKPVMTASVLTR